MKNMDMNSINSYFTIMEGIANCVFGNIKTKENVRDLLIMSHVDFANRYEENMEFRREADFIYNRVKGKR